MTMAQAISFGAPAPVLAVLNGVPTTTSTYVAEYFGKQHNNVLRDIRALIALDADQLLNFEQVTRQVHRDDGSVVEYPEFRITEEGFMLLAMGFTGKKALGYKLAFIAEFKRLRAAVGPRALPTPADATMQAVPEIDVAALLLSGQSDPVPLTPQQLALIDQAAWRLVGECHAMSREHLLRAVAYRSTRCDREDPANTGIKALLDSVTLGQALSHHYYNQVRAVETLLSCVRDLVNQNHAQVLAHVGAAGQSAHAPR
jgi:Rha family phage regulatory protein